MASHTSCSICQLPAGPADQTPEGELRPGRLPQLPQLRPGPALAPWSMGGSVALGVGVGVGAGGGVVEAGGGGGPGEVFLVRAVGVRGERAGRGRTQTREKIDIDSASGFGLWLRRQWSIC